MGEEEKKGEITIEELYEGLKVAAIINCFEKEFGKMPHPLRFFKFRRRVDYFEVFLKGVAVGEKLAELVQKVEKKKTIEVVGEDE